MHLLAGVLAETLLRSALNEEDEDRDNQWDKGLQSSGRRQLLEAATAARALMPGGFTKPNLGRCPALPHVPQPLRGSLWERVKLLLDIHTIEGPDGSLPGGFRCKVLALEDVTHSHL